LRPGNAGWLAGEASCDEIDVLEVELLSCVMMFPRVREVFVEYA
jgi:hypothetical protein